MMTSNVIVSAKLWYCTMASETKSSTLLLKPSAASKLFEYSRIPTSEEIGESLLSAAARGDQKKLKRIIKTGRYLVLEIW